MEICMAVLGFFGASFAAVPSAALDSLVSWLIPRFKQANSGLERIDAKGEVTPSDRELAPLNRLLGANAMKLTRATGDGLLAQKTTGVIAPADQLIWNEKGDPVGVINLAQAELDRRIRNARTYIGLGIMAIGFLLQWLGALF